MGLSEKAGLIYQKIPSLFCLQSEGASTSCASPAPSRGSGRVEPEEEQKHLPSQTQTLQLTGLGEEVQAELKKHDEAEEWQIRK